MSASTKQSIRIYQGEDFSHTFSAPGVGPNALVRAQMRRWPAQNAPVIATFGATVNVGSGTVTISLTDSQTALLKRSGDYDVIITDGSISTVVGYGKAVVIAGVSTGEPAPPPLDDLIWDSMTQSWDELSEELGWENLDDPDPPDLDVWLELNETWDALSSTQTWETI